MPRRFYCPERLQSGPLVLGPAESHHLLRVLRIQTGDTVVLFDGAGTETDAKLTGVSGDLAVLSASEPRPSLSESAVRVTLATAVPKGDRFGWLVEKAVELGVSRLVPLRTQRSIVDPGAGKLQKMEQTVVAASKQCGRSTLMEISPVVDWKEFLKNVPATAALVVSDPSGVGWKELEAGWDEIVFCVGPEGGFAPEELDQAMAGGAKLLSLGPRILRIETAGLMLASLAGTLT